MDAAIGGNFQAGQVALVALADGVAQLRPQVMSVAVGSQCPPAAPAGVALPSTTVGPQSPFWCR
ncbi:hypothetical protein WJ968_27760 [Achromobacter xylosoxidans]